MNISVQLIAEGINATAKNESQALSYLTEDAHHFRRDWSYADGEIDQTDDEVSDDAGDAIVDVDVDPAPGRGERIWTGRAIFTVVVAKCANDDEARAEARRLLAA